MIALCDNNLSTANHLAKICEKELNTTPKIYDNFNDLLKIEKPDERLFIYLKYVLEIFHILCQGIYLFYS